MNLEELAIATADKIKPSLIKMIESNNKSTHPEIVAVRKLLEDERNHIIGCVREAIHKVLENES